MLTKLSVILGILILGCISAQDTNPTARSLDYAKGHDTFRSLFFKNHEKEFLDLVKNGQTPRTLFISCSDSRVVPELISSASPGQLFVVRTAGNFVPIYEGYNTSDGVTASIQYALEVLNVTDIIVCGHSHCGAIAALFKDLPPSLDVVSRWIKWGDQAKKLTDNTVNYNASPEEKAAVAEKLSVLYQLEHLLSIPVVKKKAMDNQIFIHGWYFDIEKGLISYYDPETYQFLPLQK